LIEIGSKTAVKNYTNKQTDRQTNKRYENNGHLAVNQKIQTHDVPVTCCRWRIKCRNTMINRCLKWWRATTPTPSRNGHSRTPSTFHSFHRTPCG